MLRLLHAVLRGRLGLVEALQRAVVALVQPPGVVHRDPHLVQLLEREPQRLDRALQHGGVGHVEDVARLAQRAAAGDGLLDALLAEIDVGPAREPVFLVPGAFAVPDENELLHDVCDDPLCIIRRKPLAQFGSVLISLIPRLTSSRSPGVPRGRRRAPGHRPGPRRRAASSRSASQSRAGVVAAGEQRLERRPGEGHRLARLHARPRAVRAGWGAYRHQKPRCQRRNSRTRVRPCSSSPQCSRARST